MGLHWLYSTLSPKTSEANYLGLNRRQVSPVSWLWMPGYPGEGWAAPELMCFAYLGSNYRRKLQLREVHFSLIGFHQSPGLGGGVLSNLAWCRGESCGVCGVRRLCHLSGVRSILTTHIRHTVSGVGDWFPGPGVRKTGVGFRFRRWRTSPTAQLSL